MYLGTRNIGNLVAAGCSRHLGSNTNEVEDGMLRRQAANVALKHGLHQRLEVLLAHVDAAHHKVLKGVLELAVVVLLVLVLARSERAHRDHDRNVHLGLFFRDGVNDKRTNVERLIVDLSNVLVGQLDKCRANLASRDAKSTLDKKTTGLRRLQASCGPAKGSHSTNAENDLARVLIDGIKGILAVTRGTHGYDDTRKNE
jgi:hypothetical protein